MRSLFQKIPELRNEFRFDDYFVESTLGLQSVVCLPSLHK